ncbi:MAG: HEAT repeat domain-containing protein [Bauldia sp.]|nr:HEAT repeat domain-containing protein [Bauldia sp.]
MRFSRGLEAIRRRCPARLIAGTVVPAVLVLGASLLVGASGAATPPPPTDATYVGAETCASCHSAEAGLWRGSQHAHAMEHATADSVLGNFDGTSFEKDGVTTTFSRDGDAFIVRTDGPDGALEDFKVLFTFGVSPLQQYLVELPGGRLQALPVAWDSRPAEEGGQRWFHLYPDETIPAGDELHWTGRLQNWNTMCADCHSTNVVRNYDLATDTYGTTYSEINVACESCHGPGSRHVDWAKKSTGWEAMADMGLVVALDERKDAAWILDPETGNSRREPARATMREIDTCAVCHSRRGPVTASAVPGAPIGDSYRVVALDPGLYFPDGQNRDEVYVYGSFLESRMFHEGVTCSDCHEPHSLALRFEKNGVCTQCHSAEKFDTPDHHHHPMNTAGAECASCHMPERTYMVVDPRRDHSFRIPRPDLSTALGTPNTCNACHADQTPAWASEQIASWHPDPHAPFQQFGQTLRDGELRAPGARERLLALADDNGQPGIARASAIDRLDRIPTPEAFAVIVGLLHDPDPLVRRSAAAAFATIQPQARSPLLDLAEDPVRDVRLEAARLLAEVPEMALAPEAVVPREQLIAEYRASQLANADRPESHHNLGLVDLALGRTADAEEDFRNALKVDPRFVPAAVNLADLLQGADRDAEGEAVLREVMALVPDDPSPHLALGFWMVRNGRGGDALDELRRAAELGAGSPRFAYVYAVALADAGRTGEAITMLRDNLVRHPYDRDSLIAVAVYERQAGDIAAAIGHAELLARLEPDDASIRDFINQLRN